MPKVQVFDVCPLQDKCSGILYWVNYTRSISISISASRMNRNNNNKYTNKLSLTSVVFLFLRRMHTVTVTENASCAQRTTKRDAGVYSMSSCNVQIPEPISTWKGPCQWAIISFTHYILSLKWKNADPIKCGARDGSLNCPYHFPSSSPELRIMTESRRKTGIPSRVECGSTVGKNWIFDQPKNHKTDIKYS